MQARRWTQAVSSAATHLSAPPMTAGKARKFPLPIHKKSSRISAPRRTASPFFSCAHGRDLLHRRSGPDFPQKVGHAFRAPAPSSPRPSAAARPRCAPPPPHPAYLPQHRCPLAQQAPGPRDSSDALALGMGQVAVVQVVAHGARTRSGAANGDGDGRAGPPPAGRSPSDTPVHHLAQGRQVEHVLQALAQPPPEGWGTPPRAAPPPASWPPLRRCCHSGARLPGVPSAPSSRARAAHSRNRAANRAIESAHALAHDAVPARPESNARRAPLPGRRVLGGRATRSTMPAPVGGRPPAGRSPCVARDAVGHGHAPTARARGGRRANAA